MADLIEECLNSFFRSFSVKVGGDVEHLFWGLGVESYPIGPEDLISDDRSELVPEGLNLQSDITSQSESHGKDDIL